jgi:hypothetical protein
MVMFNSYVKLPEGIYIIHNTYDYICAAQGFELTTGIELGTVSLQSLKPLLAIDYTQTACCFLKFKMMSFAMLKVIVDTYGLSTLIDSVLGCCAT